MSSPLFSSEDDQSLAPSDSDDDMSMSQIGESQNIESEMDLSEELFPSQSSENEDEISTDPPSTTSGNQLLPPPSTENQLHPPSAALLPEPNNVSPILLEQPTTSGISIGPPSTSGNSVATPFPNHNWNWAHGVPTVERNNFDPNISGWTVPEPDDKKEISFWRLTFPPDIIEDIVKESNVYAAKDLAKEGKNSRRDKSFQNITSNDLLRYLCIRILMSIEQRPEQSEYWSSNPMLRSYIIPKIMTLDKFQSIQKYLHFTNEDLPNDKIGKIRALWERVMDVSKSLLIPHEHISVDESLTKFRGRFGPKQFIPSKRNRDGVKTFSVVDNETRFVLDSKIYEGKQDAQSKNKKKLFGCGGSVVLELCGPYLNKYRTIYIDNYFTSPNLALKLLNEKTYLCGTMRSGRKHSPPVPKLKVGECMAFSHQHEKETIVIEFWRDKRIVRMISSGINHKMAKIKTKRGKEVTKPQSVLDYNSRARGIDLADMCMSLTDSGRKTKKWTVKCFFRLLDITVYNAWRMLISMGDDASISLKDFKRNLVTQILDETGGLHKSKKIVVSYTNGNLLRLTGRHFIKKVSDTLKQCVVCSQHNKRARTKYGCADCGVSLCVDNCFERYHTEPNY